MDQDVNKRIDLLEQEVKNLKKELSQLRTTYVQHPKTQTEQKPEMKEKPLTKYFFPLEQSNVEEKNEVVNSSTAVQLEQSATTKPKRSLEEQFLSFLPKMFMVILVLGVLWGLKLASDYGFLSDSIKIIGGYGLSILLFTCAYLFDKKQKLSEPVVVSLYGGAYIVGILTTAAGAILYDVLNLNVALMLAFVFIAYGIGISYVKQSEALTVFVAFTSLLLPYLLEYMEFHYAIIASYVLIITLALQVVIWKYKQALALYVSTFFAMLALIVLSITTDNSSMLLGYGIIVILAVLFATWEKVCSVAVKNRRIHNSLLFLFSAYSVIALMILFDFNKIPFFVCMLLAVVQLAFSIYLFTKQNRDAFDVVASTVILSILAYLINVDVDVQLARLFAFVFISIGLFVGLKLRVSFMKVMYSFLFFNISIFIYGWSYPEPLFSLETLLLVLVLVVMGAAYVYAKRPKEDVMPFELNMQKYYVMEIVPIGLFLFTWAFISKVDIVYPIFTTMVENSYGGYGLLRDILLALLIAVVIVLPKKWVGVALPVVALVVFMFKSFGVHINFWGYSGEFLHQLLVRVVYIFVTLAIFIDIWKKGFIYRNYENVLKPILDSVFVAGVLITLFIVYQTTELFALNNYLSDSIRGMFNTFSIFIAAIGSLMVANRNEWKKVKYLGFTLLIVGFVKMIFFDLTNLDILVRSVLFIVIGAVGLLVSNRLIKK